MDARKSVIFVFQSVKPILQTTTYLIQYKVLQIQFWSLKCTTKIRKNFEHSHSLPSSDASDYKLTMGRLDEEHSGNYEGWEEGECALHR